MGITNELREYARDWEWLDADNAEEVEDQLVDIAYHIDKAHKAAVDKAHADGERNGLQQARSASEDWQRGFDEGFASADDWLAEHEDAMAEHGWAKLPVDADGVPIRIGDVVVNATFEGYVFMPAEVVGYHRCCDTVYPIVENDGEYQIEPKKVRHRYEPTVEDVLEEFVARWLETHHDDLPSLKAEYAAKLRLKEVEE